MPVSSFAEVSANTREREAQFLVDLVRLSRVTVLYGEQGTDKSAFLHTSVMPLLEATAPSAPRELRVLFDAWGEQPVPALLRQLEEALFGAAKKSMPDSGPGSSLAARLLAWQQALDVSFLIVFDRFENYLTAPRHLPHVAEFEDEFVGMVSEGRVQANFLVCLDEKATPLLSRLLSRVPQLADASVRLPRLAEEELSTASVQARRAEASAPSREGRERGPPKLADAPVFFGSERGSSSSSKFEALEEDLARMREQYHLLATSTASRNHVASHADAATPRAWTGSHARSGGAAREEHIRTDIGARGNGESMELTRGGVAEPIAPLIGNDTEPAADTPVEPELPEREEAELPALVKPTRPDSRMQGDPESSPATRAEPVLGKPWEADRRTHAEPALERDVEPVLHARPVSIEAASPKELRGAGAERVQAARNIEEAMTVTQPRATAEPSTTSLVRARSGISPRARLALAILAAAVLGLLVVALWEPTPSTPSATQSMDVPRAAAPAAAPADTTPPQQPSFPASPADDQTALTPLRDSGAQPEVASSGSAEELAAAAATPATGATRDTTPPQTVPSGRAQSGGEASVRTERTTQGDPALRPAVYMHVRSEAQRARAERLIAPLARRGIRVSGIKVVPVGPSSADLRYFRSEEAAQAAQVARTLRELGLRSLRVKYIAGWEARATPRQYEVWLPPQYFESRGR